MMMLLDSVAKAVYTLPPDKLEKAEHLYHARTLAHFGDTLWMIIALWLLVRWDAGGRIRDWAARRSGRKWVQGFLVAPVWLLILSVLDGWLPLVHKGYWGLIGGALVALGAFQTARTRVCPVNTLLGVNTTTASSA